MSDPLLSFLVNTLEYQQVSAIKGGNPFGYLYLYSKKRSWNDWAKVLQSKIKYSFDYFKTIMGDLDYSKINQTRKYTFTSLVSHWRVEFMDSKKQMCTSENQNEWGKITYNKKSASQIDKLFRDLGLFARLFVEGDHFFMDLINQMEKERSKLDKPKIDLENWLNVFYSEDEFEIDKFDEFSKDPILTKTLVTNGLQTFRSYIENVRNNNLKAVVSFASKFIFSQELIPTTCGDPLKIQDVRDPGIVPGRRIEVKKKTPESEGKNEQETEEDKRRIGVEHFDICCIECLENFEDNKIELGVTFLNIYFMTRNLDFITKQYQEELTEKIIGILETQHDISKEIWVKLGPKYTNEQSKPDIPDLKEKLANMKSEIKNAVVVLSEMLGEDDDLSTQKIDAFEKILEWYAHDSKDKIPNFDEMLTLLGGKGKTIFEGKFETLLKKMKTFENEKIIQRNIINFIADNLIPERDLQGAYGEDLLENDFRFLKCRYGEQYKKAKDAYLLDITEEY